MPLGTEVGIGPGHTVLDRDPGAQHPHFSADMSIVANGRPSQQLLSFCSVYSVYTTTAFESHYRYQVQTRWLYCVECHNTVLGEEALLIYIVPVGYVKTGRYGKT